MRDLSSIYNTYTKVEEEKETLPMKAEVPPSLVMAQATLAGAPPGALRKALDSANDTPAESGTKSISISPKHTIDGLFDILVLLLLPLSLYI